MLIIAYVAWTTITPLLLPRLLLLLLLTVYFHCLSPFWYLKQLYHKFILPHQWLILLSISCHRHSQSYSPICLYVIKPQQIDAADADILLVSHQLHGGQFLCHQPYLRCLLLAHQDLQADLQWHHYIELQYMHLQGITAILEAVQPKLHDLQREPSPLLSWTLSFFHAPYIPVKI